MSVDQLQEMQSEIRSNIVQNQAFASDLQYWQSLLQKVKSRQAVLTIETIYDRFIEENNGEITYQVEQAKMAEAAKNAMGQG